MPRNLSHSMTLVLLFSIPAGVSSGVVTALPFIRAYVTAGDAPQGFFLGSNLIPWLLFTALAYILFGALGLLTIRGRCAALSWAVKLWAGGAGAILAGLLTAALVFRTFLPFPLLGLLPKILGLLIASYLLAALLLTGLCLMVSRV